MKVKELLEYVEKYNIDLESEVLVERVTDYYFDVGNWETIKMNMPHPALGKNNVDEFIDTHCCTGKGGKFLIKCHY